MIRIEKAEDFKDLRQIKQLNLKNLKNNLTIKDQKEHGFVTAEYSIKFLEKINKIENSIIVKYNDKVAGYALVVNKLIYGKNKLLDDLIDRIEQIVYKGEKLKKINYAFVGQLCVEKKIRGLGIVDKIYEFYKKEYSDKYQYLITEIDEKNVRSLKVHFRNGFKIIDRFYWGSTNWNIILWDWNKQ